MDESYLGTHTPSAPLSSDHFVIIYFSIILIFAGLPDKGSDSLLMLGFLQPVFNENVSWEINQGLLGRKNMRHFQDILFSVFDSSRFQF